MKNLIIIVFIISPIFARPATYQELMTVNRHMEKKIQALSDSLDIV